MRLKLVLNFLCLLFAVLSTSAQIQNSSITIQNLVNSNKPISNISYENIKYVNISDTPIKNFPQVLIKTSKKLFVFANGSGRLYEVLNDNNKIEIKRIDSTIFYGYNLGSFPFAYRDTIYSLGGYGMWRINGQLRMYVDKAKQWDVVGLDKEIPVLTDRNTLLWYDIADGKIYIGWSVQRNQAIRASSLNETKFVYDESVLNLVTKSWQKLGTLNNYLIENSALIGNITSSPWGQLISFGNKLMIIDFAGNRILYLNSRRNEIVNSVVFADPDTRLYYFKDSTLYFGSTGKNTLDSIQLHTNDFLVSDKTVYEQDGNSIVFPSIHNNKLLYFSGGFIIFFGIGLLMWKKRKSFQKKTSENNLNGFSENNVYDLNTLNEVELKTTINNDVINEYSSNQINGYNNQELIFDEKELQLIIAIYKNSVLGETTSIEELNKTLGVTQKNIQIQKKQRSDVIRSINKKYCLINHVHNDVIERRKNDLDKRTVEYFINNVKLEEVKKIINA
jgi:hypothetical protein